MAVLPKKDVIIIGYGAAGGPISVELAKAGYSAVALERGTHRDNEDFSGRAFDTLRFVTRQEMVPKTPDVPITFRSDLNATARPASNRMANTVGGSSVHWSGQSWRYYEEDFRVKSTIEKMYDADQLSYLEEDGANIQDWPVSYEDLEPFYEKAEYHLGVGGFPGNIKGKIRPVDPDEGNPYEAPRQRDFPMRSLRDNATDLTYRKGALELGLRPFHVATAITSEPYTNPDGVERPGCSYCAFCTSHGCWNKSKASTLDVLMPTAEKTGNFEIRPNSHVLRINQKNGRAVSVEYIDLVTGEHHTQPGDIFYMGSYTYQNIRLLLYSGITSNGQVGKYFINRAGPSVSAVFDDRYLNGWAAPAVQRQGVDDFNGENRADEKLQLAKDDFFIRGSFLGSPCQRNPLESYQIRPPEVPSWGREYKEYFTKYLNRLMSLQILGEPIAYESSYIDLDPNYTDRYGVPAARVQRQAKQNEIRMARFIHQKGSEILKAAGASKVWGNVTPTPTASMTHDCGGLRMGDNPPISATNRYGQLWEVPNILVGGGSLFPTLSGHNPTMTIWTLAYWTAAAVTDRKIDLGNSQAFT
ncbi:MAG: GMC oxidoreductase [Thermomicrobiales bacterium]